MILKLLLYNERKSTIYSATPRAESTVNWIIRPTLSASADSWTCGREYGEKDRFDAQSSSMGGVCTRGSGGGETLGGRTRRHCEELHSYGLLFIV